ncbi:hypothetical protein CEXT_692091 [Caerostris extrusa]|uniref:Uncharacterized protein n=1 Tax=Caerostris extrusa TaxID=172846 RepID=A0AAV4SEQ0_CAEEX|nr:hypothetical protein CEXT_692091 [Caerostris extrusa]
MNTYSVPPVQVICLSETVILVFSRTDIGKWLHNLGHHFVHPHRHLDYIEKRGKELASALSIPVRVKNTLIDVLRYMATEIFVLAQRQDADSVSRLKIASNYRLTADLYRLIDESANTCIPRGQSIFWSANVPTILPQTATLTKR